MPVHTVELAKQSGLNIIPYTFEDVKFTLKFVSFSGVSLSITTKNIGGAAWKVTQLLVINISYTQSYTLGLFEIVRKVLCLT